MEDEKTLSEKESFRIIEQMIQTAKQEQSDDGRGWILWGWMLFTVSLATYANIEFGWFEVSFFWKIFSGVVVIYFFYSLLKSILFKKSRKVKTYTRELFDKLNMGFFIFLVFIIVSVFAGTPGDKAFMYLLGLYGFWILVYGAVVNFRPAIIAACITWIVGFAGLFIDRFILPGSTGHVQGNVSSKINPELFQWTMLFHALGVLTSYIIPGHLANREFNKTKRESI